LANDLPYKSTTYILGDAIFDDWLKLSLAYTYHDGDYILYFNMLSICFALLFGLAKHHRFLFSQSKNSSKNDKKIAKNYQKNTEKIKFLFSNNNKFWMLHAWDKMLR
jgi:hypothetical protein